MEKVLIVGANGRFGRAATQAFTSKGCQVNLFARSAPLAKLNAHHWIEGDALDLDCLTRAASGCDVIVNALSPPLSKWVELMPILTANMIAAAHHANATIMVPGNIYNFGSSMPLCLTEKTPQLATGPIGKARIKMEEDYAEAAKGGVQTIVLRGGNFVERHVTGNWFDSQITAGIAKGKIAYPGPLDLMNSWAYLPDIGRALEELAAKRSDLPTFETIGFPGFSLTGSEFVKVLERVCERNLKVTKIPWTAIKFLSLFKADLRGTMEVSYLWRTSHVIDGSRFEALLSDFRPTQVDCAFREAVAGRVD